MMRPFATDSRLDFEMPPVGKSFPCLRRAGLKAGRRFSGCGFPCFGQQNPWRLHEL